MRVRNKLIFSLCSKCTLEELTGGCKHSDEERALIGTWVTPELFKALNIGYKLVAVYEVWNFPVMAQYDPISGMAGLFEAFINKWIKIKQEASGYPEGCDSEEAKDQYVAEYFEREKIQLDKEKILKNPGLRALAKLMVNSFWGELPDIKQFLP
jgi:hypothetical protein